MFYILGIIRTDSEHSINSMDGEAFTETKISSTQEKTDHGTRYTTTKTTKTSSSSQNAGSMRSTSMQKSEGAKKTERSFLDSSSKVTGVQDILSRMKNADIG